MQERSPQERFTGAAGSPGAVGLAWLVAAGVAIAIDAALLEPGRKLTREGGSVETASALLYFVAFAAFLWRRGARGRMWPVPLLLLAMAAREFDADKRFTSEGLLSLKILTRDTPFHEKALGVAVLAALVLAMALLLRRGLGAFLGDLHRGAAWALFLAGALGLAAITKSIDELQRKLAPLGVDIPDGVARLAGSAEEYLELGIPILLLMAILQLTATTRLDT